MARPRTAQLDVMEAARAITRERLQAQQDDGLPPGVTWCCVRDALVPRGWRPDNVRALVKWLRHTGQLRPVGSRRMPHSMRPLTVYAPADDEPVPQASAGMLLASAMHRMCAA